MTRHLRSEAGFTLIEMLMASAIMVVVTGAVFALLNPANGTFRREPEQADVQQRVRVGVDSLTKDLIMAGAGTYMGAGAGALDNFFAPVMPYRRGDINDDPTAGVFYRPDTISILYVPPTPAQTTVVKVEGNNSQEIDVDPEPGCPDKLSGLCGFTSNPPMRVLLIDPDSGAYDVTTLTNIQDPALHLQHSGKLSSQYDSGGAMITEVASHTYYLKSDDATKTYQLMHYDGYQTDLPVVDNVVKLSFDYFGDPQPPQLLPGKCLTAGCVGPFTTYGPKPPPLGIDTVAGDEYGPGENCLFKVDANGQQVPRLSVLAGGGAAEVQLDPAIFLDAGTATHWCPNAATIDRYDADLLRIRKVRVHLRVQAALAAMRGPAGLLFTKGGAATDSSRWVPDQEITFDVTPRNMNLGR